MHGVNVIKLVQSSTTHGVLKLWYRCLDHFNVKRIHMLQT
jgi:hypothetical protein